MQMTIYLMDSLWRNYSTLIWNMKTKMAQWQLTKMQIKSAIKRILLLR